MKIRTQSVYDNILASVNKLARHDCQERDGLIALGERRKKIRKAIDASGSPH